MTPALPAPRIPARACTSETSLRRAATASEARGNPHPRTHLVGPGLRTRTHAHARSIHSEAGHNQMTGQTTKELRR